MRWIASLLLLMWFNCSTASCLVYGTTTLEGTLRQETFPGRPNFESIARGDAAETRLFVILDHYVCVSKGQQDDEPFVERARAFQLGTDSALANDDGPLITLSTYIGGRVTCTGRLFYQETAHDHSQVLLDTARCRSGL
jgi:hypothetical protein